ncbi:MAG: hypothetical protein QOH31_731 [Verrucomicrobiota bacterium]
MQRLVRVSNCSAVLPSRIRVFEAKYSNSRYFGLTRTSYPRFSRCRRCD